MAVPGVVGKHGRQNRGADSGASVSDADLPGTEEPITDSDEALNAFGTPAVFPERHISHAKHIEVQILGDKLIVLEAMKMLTTLSAAVDGTVDEIPVQNGDQVDSDDLLLKLMVA